MNHTINHKILMAKLLFFGSLILHCNKALKYRKQLWNPEDSPILHVSGLEHIQHTEQNTQILINDVSGKSC